MPIPVVCGNCQTRLNAPDAAAGKKVKCPKCQTVMAVPGAAAPAPPPPAADTPFDFNDDAPPPPPRSGGESRPARPAPESPPPPPAGAAFDFGAAVSSASEPKGRGDRPRREDDDRPRRRDDDDRPRRPRPRDEDAEDDDRPRRRRPAEGGKKSMLPMLLLGGGFLLLVCCGGGGFGVYYAVGKIKEEGERRKAENDAKEKQIADELKRRAGDAAGGAGSLPAGWTKFDAPDKSFRASFPATPGDGGLTYQTPAVQSAKSYESLESDGSVVCTLGVLKFRPNSKAVDRERDLKAAAELMRIAADTVAQPRAVDWLGGQAKEAVSASNLQQGVTYTTRWVLVGNTGYIAQVQHKSKPDAAAKFFSSVEPLSK